MKKKELLIQLAALISKFEIESGNNKLVGAEVLFADKWKRYVFNGEKFMKTVKKK